MIVTNGQLYIQRFKSALSAIGIDHGVSDTVPALIPSQSTSAASRAILRSSFSDLYGFRLFSSPIMKDSVAGPLNVGEGVEALDELDFIAPTEAAVLHPSANLGQTEDDDDDEVQIIGTKNLKLNHERRLQLLKTVSKSLSKHSSPYMPSPSTSIEYDMAHDFLTKFLEDILWPKSKRVKESISIEEEENQEMELGGDSFLGIGMGEKRGTSVKADDAGGSDHLALLLLEELPQGPSPVQPLGVDRDLLAVIGRDDVVHGPDVTAGVDPYRLAG